MLRSHRRVWRSGGGGDRSGGGGGGLRDRAELDALSGRKTATLGRGVSVGGTCGDGRRKELEEVVADDEERRMAGNGAAARLHGWRHLWRWGEGVGGTGG
jgi:hypothetical protein